MTGSKLVTSAILFVAVLSAACEYSPPTPTAPDSPGIATNQPTELKGGGGGGDAFVADVIIGDSGCPASLSSLQSTAPGDVNTFFQVLWHHTGGLIVRPAGMTYPLTDDVALFTGFRNNSTTLTAVQLWGQDIDGPDGIQHNTDEIPINPQPALATGFTLHVHANGVTVYRLSGHTGGKRVRPIGTICIGDVVYR